MDGILLVDKPTGLSSFDVIRKLRQLMRSDSSAAQLLKFGHAGTLDPMATGLLIVLVGTACKQADRFLKLDKAYLAEVTLGSSSSTDDAEGELLAGSGVRPKQAAIEQALADFTGEQEQIPPQHSAIKVAGKRAYELARKGHSVQLKSRTVTIHTARLKRYKYPKLELEVSVSSGTYIRALARDLGKALGTDAYLSALRRTRVGPYVAKDSVQLEQLNPDALKKNLKMLQ
jgi:tRNA pseudouridine55 synthase